MIAILFAAILIGTMSSGLADEPAMRIRLKDGSFASGALVATSKPGRIAWKCAGFDEAFEFDLSALSSITRIENPQNEPAAVPGEKAQSLELADGTMLVGELLSMDDDWLSVRSKLLGPVKVQRRAVLAIADAGYAGKILYSGPFDDHRWKRLGAKEDWNFEAGALVATKSGAAISGHVDLPAKSQVSLSLYWKGDPNFVISFGTLMTSTAGKIEVASAAKLEVWDKQLALVREVDAGADIDMLSDLSPANPRIDLSVFIDQIEGTVVACDAHGNPLKTLKVPSKKSTVRPAVHVANFGQSLTIERFEVREWDGVLSSAAASSNAQVLDLRGKSLPGSIAGFDAGSRELLIKSPQGVVSKLPIDLLRRGLIEGSDMQAKEGVSANKASFPTQADATKAQATAKDTPSASGATKAAADKLSADIFPTDDHLGEEKSAAVPEPIIEVVFMDRTRLKGVWQPSDGQQLQFKAGGLSENIRFTPPMIRGVLGSTARYVNLWTKEKSGTLKSQECQITGFLLANSSAGSRTGLLWHPHGSHNACEISESATGAIVYRAPLPKAVNQPAATANTPKRAMNPGVALFLGNRGQTQSTENSSGDSSNSPEIMFRTGDAINGRVTRVDERGVTFSSAQTKTEFALHDQIQHVRLTKLRGPAAPSAEKLKRLMTVPRSMKQDPPTHLFLSVTGDHLRGRLVRLEGDMLTVEIRLEMREVPLAQIAQIIWLHDRDWSDAKKQDPVQAPAAVQAPVALPFQVHAIGSSDRGLTFKPKQITEGILKGNSDLLGDCSVNVNELNQLLFGGDIGEQIRAFREDPWKLSLAQYPRVYQDAEGGNSAPPGENSPLIGKLAPDFALKSLSGESFRLNQHRDRIVVLDFWASWCGPCIQTMPLVEEVVNEVGTDKVNLVAVNIQDTPARAQAAVERLKLSATVLLDGDGQTAAAYAASAIPQTVIIDRQGNVTHLFVGGGPKFITQFREALQSVVGK